MVAADTPATPQQKQPPQQPQQLAPTCILGLCELSAAGTRAVRCLQPAAGRSTLQAASTPIEHQGFLPTESARPAFRLRDTEEQAPTVLACRTVSDGAAAAAAPLVSLLSLDAPVAPEYATAVALALVDALVALGVRRLVVPASLPLRGLSGPQQAETLGTTEAIYTNDAALIKSAGVLPLGPEARLEDPLVCALQAVAAVTVPRVEVVLLVCHGHVVKGQDPRHDGTVAVRFVWMFGVHILNPNSKTMRRRLVS